MRNVFRLALTAVLVSPCLGFTDCDQFNQVTVPAVDHEPPTAWGGAYDLRTHSYLALAASPDDQTLYRHRELNAPIVAVATALDGDGAGRVELHWRRRQACINPEPAMPPHHWVVTETSGIETQTQPGTVGATVSTGVYAVASTRPGDCGAGEIVIWSDVYFHVEAWDLHGNFARGGEYSIDYTAPGWPE